MHHGQREQAGHLELRGTMHITTFKRLFKDLVVFEKSLQYLLTVFPSLVHSLNPLTGFNRCKKEPRKQHTSADTFFHSFDIHRNNEHL